jgi:hypothetical protein
MDIDKQTFANSCSGSMADESQPSSGDSCGTARWLTNKPSSRPTGQGPDLLVFDQVIDYMARYSKT